MATLSGGEAVLAGLASLLIRPPAVTLLDEPTNNLDRIARALALRRGRAVAGGAGGGQSRPGTAGAGRPDRRAAGRRRSASTAATSRATSSARRPSSRSPQRTVRAAEGELRREQRQLIETRTKLDRRVSAPARKAETGEAGAEDRRGRPEAVGAGVGRQAADRRTAAIGGRGPDNADARPRKRCATTTGSASTCRAPRCRPGRTVLRGARGGDRSPVIRGPERIALLGRNGSGKTTLLRTIVGLGAERRAPTSGRAAGRPVSPTCRNGWTSWTTGDRARQRAIGQPGLPPAAGAGAVWPGS